MAERSEVDAPVFSDNSVTPRLLITFARGLNENLNPHISECSAGYNFDLAISQSSLVPRSPYDLVSTTPNSGGITGYLQLVKRDNTETTLVVSGDTVYKWNGANTYTAVATVVTGISSTTAALLRSATWALGDYLVIVDLNLQNAVSKWDGTTYSILTTGLVGTFYAKYAIVHLNRIWFFNIKLGSTTYPHMILASKFEDPTTLDNTLRGGATDVGGGVFATGLEAFYLFVPDLKAINGVELFQNTLLISSDRGRMWSLQGTSGKDFQFVDFYDTQPAIGLEAIKSIGNDVTFVSPGGEINLISAVQAFGNVKNFSISRWIPDTTRNLRVINAIVYDEMNQKVLYFIPDKALVLFKDILAQQDGLSPWSVYTTLDPCGFNTFVAKYMLKPGTSDYAVFFGCNQGEILMLPGVGVGDGGAPVPAALCTSSVVTPIVLGTSATDNYINNASDQEGQTYQQNANSGGAWIGHIVADDGTPGNRLDGNGYLRCFDLVDVHTSATLARYRNNSTVFASGVTVADGIKGIDADGSAYVAFGTRIFKMRPTYTIPVAYFDSTHANSSSGLAFDSSGAMWGFNTTTNVPVRMTAIDYIGHTCTETDATVPANTFGKYGRNAGGIADRVYYIKSNTIRYIQPGNLAAGATDVITDAVSNLMFVIGDDGNIYYARTISAGPATVIVKADANGVVLATCSISNSTQQVPELYSDGFIWSAGENSNNNFYKISATTMTLTSTIPNGADWFRVVGPFTPGTVVVNGFGSGVTQFGGLGFIDCTFP